MANDMIIYNDDKDLKLKVQQSSVQTTTAKLKALIMVNTKHIVC